MTGFALGAGNGNTGRGSRSGGQEGEHKIGFMEAVDGASVGVGDDGVAEGKLHLSGVG